MAEKRPKRRGCAKYLRRKLETTLIETRGKYHIENVGCIGRENTKESFHFGQPHLHNSVIRAVEGMAEERVD
jgi:hypothetical protein